MDSTLLGALQAAVPPTVAASILSICDANRLSPLGLMLGLEHLAASGSPPRQKILCAKYSATKDQIKKGVARLRSPDSTAPAPALPPEIACSTTISGDRRHHPGTTQAPHQHQSGTNLTLRFSKKNSEQELASSLPSSLPSATADLRRLAVELVEQIQPREGCAGPGKEEAAEAILTRLTHPDWPPELVGAGIRRANDEASSNWLGYWRSLSPSSAAKQHVAEAAEAREASRQVEARACEVRANKEAEYKRSSEEAERSRLAPVLAELAQQGETHPDWPLIRRHLKSFVIDQISQGGGLAVTLGLPGVQASIRRAIVVASQ